MTQTERRIYLIQSLLKEQPRYADISIPAGEQEQKNPGHGYPRIIWHKCRHSRYTPPFLQTAVFPWLFLTFLPFIPSLLSHFLFSIPNTPAGLTFYEFPLFPEIPHKPFFPHILLSCSQNTKAYPGQALSAS